MALNIFLAVRTKKWPENVDMVPGDVNGANWRRKPGPQQQLDSTIQETFKYAKLPVAAPLCSFVKPPKSQSEWIIRKHGAFGINREELGLRPKDQPCHHEVWVHLAW